MIERWLSIADLLAYLGVMHGAIDRGEREGYASAAANGEYSEG